MAYTYDDFISAAQKAGQLERFSELDLVTAQKSPEFGLSMLSLYKDMDMAETAEQQLLAREAANQLRKSYGSYTVDESGQSSFAGSYGSQIRDTMDKVNNYGGFQYGQQDDYQKLMDKVANPDGYRYDPSADPAMSAYKKAFLREGERASANALAQASAGTGGVPSSFAVTAANQAGNYYAAQLADQIPALQQAAYQRDQNALSAIQSDRQQAYDDYVNQYNMLLTMLNNQQSQDNTEYNRYLDAWNQAMQIAQQKENAAATTYDRLVSLITNVGYNPTDTELLAAGMTREQANAYMKAYAGTGSSSSGSYYAPSVDDTEDMDDEVEETMKDEPELVPKNTNNTAKFISSFTPLSEARRHGMSKEQWLRYLEKKIDSSGLTAEEIAYLEQYYGI